MSHHRGCVQRVAYAVAAVRKDEPIDKPANALTIVLTERLKSPADVDKLFEEAFANTPVVHDVARHPTASVVIDAGRLCDTSIDVLGQLIILVLEVAEAARQLTVIPPKNATAQVLLRTYGFYASLREALPGLCVFLIAGPMTSTDTLAHEDILPFTWLTDESTLQDNVLPVLKSWALSIEDGIGQERASALIGIVKIATGGSTSSKSRSARLGALLAANKSSPAENQSLISIFVGPSPIMPNPGLSAREIFNRKYRPSGEADVDWYSLDRSIKALGGRYTFRYADTIFRRDYGAHPAYESTEDDIGPMAGCYLYIQTVSTVLSDSNPAIFDCETKVNYQKFALNNAAPAQIAQAIFENLTWSPTSDIVLVDVGAVAVSEDDAASIVKSIVEWSHPHRTAIIGLRMSEQHITTVCEIVNAFYESAVIDRNFYQPVLVVGCTFRHSRWVGSTPEIIASLESQDAIRSNDVLRLASYEVGHFSAGTYQLSLNAHNLYRAIKADYSNNVAANTIASENVAYVPPALEQVRSWIDVRGVLQSFPGGHAALACLLATKMFDRNSATIVQQPSVICEEVVSDDFAKVFASSLQGSLAGPNAYQRVRPRDIASSRRLSLDHNRPVIVLVGVLGSGQTARHLMALALRQDYRVLGIAALADSRMDPSGPVAMWEKSFPVAALDAGAQLSLGINQTSVKHQYVDRVGRVETAIDVRPTWPVPTSEAIRLLGAAGAVSLGHYTSLFDRHFTFYVDAIKALTDDKTRQALIKPAVEKFVDWSRGRTDAPIVIRYPAFEYRPDAAAQLFAHALVTAAKSKLERPIIVIDTDEDYDFDGSHVVHIDWGSVTGDSIIRNLNAYRVENVERLLHMTLFSQVSDHLETHLDSFRSMTRSDGRHIEVDLWFATRLPVAAYAQYECPVCSQMARHVGWIQDYFGDGLAADRARISVRAWTPESSTSLDPIAVAFGAVNADDTSAMALLRRSEMVDAQQSVEAAHRAMQDLLSKIEEPAWLLSLLTLAVYEPQWLRTPPLSVPNVRIAIANKCLELLESSETGVDKSLRAKAIIGLRLVSKVSFARNFVRILRSVTNDAALEDLCLYVCATILARDYIANTGIPIVLAEQLAAAEEASRSQLVLTARRATRELEYAHDRATSLRARGESVATPRWETLFKLQNKVADFQNHRIYDSYRRANPRLIGGSPSNSRSFVAEWRVVVRWIVAEIVPRVTVLHSYLAATHTLENSAVFRIFENHGSGLVDLLEECSSPDSLPLDRLDTTYQAISDLFDPGVKSPALLTACSECSTPLSNFIDEFRYECEANGVDFATVLRSEHLPRVLLPSRYRTTVIHTIVGNAVKHRASAAVQPSIEFVLERGVSSGLNRNVLLRIDTFGGKVTPRVSPRLSPGGINEIKDAAPVDVRVKEDFRRIPGRGLRLGINIQAPTWSQG